MWFSERVNKIAAAFADRFNFQVETVIHQYYVEFICTYTKDGSNRDEIIMASSCMEVLK